jgi:hypothetical protein
MVVSELRELLKKYNMDELRLLAAELYKAMPKKLREEKGIDRMLADIREYQKNGKQEKLTTVQVSIDDLKQKIDQFVEDAYQQYYFAPNRYVPKKERPKWRFKVKEYIKLLQKAWVDDDGKIAVELLEKLYKMLCYACERYIFSTDDPFRSVGIAQVDLLDSIISRKLAQGVRGESVKGLIELVFDHELDRETLYSELMAVLLKNLKTPDAKELALEQCKVLKTDLVKPRPTKTKKAWSESSLDYSRLRKINNLVEMIFRLYMALGEYSEAVAYYHDNFQEKSPEVSLYILLKLSGLCP